MADHAAGSDHCPAKITCVDITAAKKIEHELQDKIAKLEAQVAG